MPKQIPLTPSRSNATNECFKWRRSLLSSLYPDDAKLLGARLSEKDQAFGYIAANTWLRKVIGRYQLLAKLSTLRPVVAKEANRLAHYLDEASAYAWLKSVVQRLQYCDTLITDLSGDTLAAWAWQKSHGFEVELVKIGTRSNAEAVKAYIELHLRQADVDFHNWQDNDKVAGLAARMITAKWWVRQARRQWIKVEQVLRECGQVHKYASPYVSHWSLKKEQQKQANQMAFLEGWEAINDQGQAYSLAQLAELGVASPDKRFAELMVRSRGLEEVAQEQDHDAWFITLTCPSKYHPISQGRRNHKYRLAKSPTVQEAHAYLNHVWQCFRAWCHRHGIAFYGVRTVEPHHDGTPHWHLIVYLDKAQSDHFLAAFKRYALAEDGQEAGAEKYRFKVLKIVPEKGTATAYITKHISKNIHGKHLDTDHETGRSGVDAAKRIVAWARLNRIKQFQFIGGASVTVWRELRRLQIKAAPRAFAAIYHAANRADYAAFIKLMGGAFAGRKQTLVTHYSDPEENQYGEMVKSIKGVANGIEVVITRLYEWRVQRKQLDSIEETVSELTWTSVNNCTLSRLLKHAHITNQTQAN